MSRIAAHIRTAGFVAAPIVVLAAAFAIQVFLAIDRHSHSVTDTLYAVYPFWGVTFLGADWLIRRIADYRTVREP